MGKDKGFRRRLGVWTCVVGVTWIVLGYATCAQASMSARIAKVEHAIVYTALFYLGFRLFHYWPVLQVMTKRNFRLFLRHQRASLKRLVPAKLG